MPSSRVSPSPHLSHQSLPEHRIQATALSKRLLPRSIMHVAPVILMAFLASAAHGADFQRQRYQAHVVQTLSTSCQDKINGCLDGAYLAKTQDTSWDRECEAAMDIKDCCAENGACSIDEIETLYDAACEPLPAGNLRDKAVFDVSSSYIYNALLNDDCRTSMTTCFDVKNEDWSDFTYTSFPELCNRFRDNYKCLVTDGKCELYMFELYTSEICEDHYRNHLKQQRIVDTMRDFSEGCQGQMMECLPTQTEEEGPSSLWSPGTHCRIFKTLRSCIVANNVCTGGNYDVAENIVCATMKPDEVAAFRLRTELMFAYVISSESCQQSMQHCLGRDGNPWENADYTMTSSQFCSWFKSKIDCFADEEEGKNNKCSAAELTVFDEFTCEDHFQRVAFRQKVYQTLVGFTARGSTCGLDECSGDLGYQMRPAAWEQKDFCIHTIAIRDCLLRKKIGDNNREIQCSSAEYDELYGTMCGAPLMLADTDKLEMEVRIRRVFVEKLKQSCQISMISAFDIQTENWSDYDFRKPKNEICDDFKNNWSELLKDEACAETELMYFDRLVCPDAFQRMRVYEQLHAVTKDLPTDCTNVISGCLPNTYWLSQKQYCDEYTKQRTCILEGNKCSQQVFQSLSSIVCAPVPSPAETQIMYVENEMKSLYDNEDLSQNCKNKLRECLSVQQEDWSDFNFNVSKSDLCEALDSQLECIVTTGVEQKCSRYEVGGFQHLLCDDFSEMIEFERKINHLHTILPHTCDMDACSSNLGFQFHPIAFDQGEYCTHLQAIKTCLLTSKTENGKVKQCRAPEVSRIEAVTCGPPLTSAQVAQIRTELDIRGIYVASPSTCQNTLLSCLLNGGQWSDFNFRQDKAALCKIVNDHRTCVLNNCSRANVVDKLEEAVCTDFNARKEHREKVDQAMGKLSSSCQDRYMACQTEQQRPDSGAVEDFKTETCNDHKFQKGCITTQKDGKICTSDEYNDLHDALCLSCRSATAHVILVLLLCAVAMLLD